jgi:hypothetical protein
MKTSFVTAWAGILLGCIAGAIQGLFFHSETWAGGYNSWTRRMLRLGHISLVALGLLNLAFAVTASAFDLGSSAAWPARLLIVGAITMPLLCYASAFRDALRHLFFVPALSVIAAAALVLWRIVTR